MTNRLTNLIFIGFIWLCSLVQVRAQTGLLPNGSFEEGANRPSHWTLVLGTGAWEAGGRTGLRCVSLTGTGEGTGYWKCDSLPLSPNEIYRVRFWTRTDPDATCGAIVAGTGNVSRDFQTGIAWEEKSYIFKNPASTGGFLALGQWQKRGRVYFDDVELRKVALHHFKRDGIVLGDGERINNGIYQFHTRAWSDFSNYSRPEVSHTARFDHNRWCFKEGEYILYKFALDGYAQTYARLALILVHLQKGNCLVEVSTQGNTWTTLGRFNDTGRHEVEIPTALLPADAVWIRIYGAGVFEMNWLSYMARLSAQPPDMDGFTWCVEPLQDLKELEAEIISLGEALPNERNAAVIHLVNKEFWARKIALVLESGECGGPLTPSVKKIEMPGHSRAMLVMGYDLHGVGTHCVKLTVMDEKSGALLVKATLMRTSAAIHDATFGHRLPAPDALGLWWAQGTYKVGRSRPLPVSIDSAISISAARNEYEPFQLVLRPTSNLRGVTLRVSDLACGHSIIKSSNVRIESVEYVSVETETDAFGCPGEWPDPLVPYESPLDLVANRNHPIWFTVYIPEDTPAGEYQGKITIHAPDVAQVNVSLNVRVWDFTLPKETHTRTSYVVTVPAEFLALKNPQERLKAHDLYMRNCAEHRIAPHDPMAETPWRYTIGGPPDRPDISFDFTEFDKAAHRYLDEFGFNGFNFGKIPQALAGFKRFSTEFNKLFGAIYGPAVEHLRHKGWLDKAYCYWFDEPRLKDYPTVIAGMNLLQQACPGLARLLTEQPEPELNDVVDIWVPVLHYFDHARCRERQEAGQQVWWYVCCAPTAPYPNYFIDHPALNHRILFWMMQKYGVTGSVYWHTTFYSGLKGALRNPWTDAMSYSPTGLMWGNGDGVLLYPPVRTPAHRPMVRGPFNSIRWEMLREGLEDREYFWLLQQAAALAKSKRESLALDDRAALDQLIREAEETLNFPETFITDLSRYTKDPQTLYALRERIAQHIQVLGQGTKSTRIKQIVPPLEPTFP